ncbi:MULTISPECIES: TauD/TfdA family dioxygenase [unclassified Microcystis]|jgi:alpha-ketoglutarate-dependent taurine dioxygenase|uniref:TauD/TfdA family dioxygenase n=1 Tax=unclassified Microcystis TaxID=2643300 RepID=UPI00257E5EC3|nr:MULTISPECIES: TauD/TfdA family dioxygenase [unclassified Microcystis]
MAALILAPSKPDFSSAIGTGQRSFTLQENLKKNGFFVFDNPWSDRWLQGLQDVTQATPVIQTNGEIIYPIKANPDAMGKSDAQSLGIGLLPHTEWSYKAIPPKYFCLRCKTPDRWGGGATTLVKFDDLMRHFTLEEQHFMADQLQYFMSKDGKESCFAPIWQRDAAIIRFSYNVLVYREFSPDLNKPVASGLDSRLMALCDKFLALFEAYHVPLCLKAEQILIMDNHTCLHSRQSYIDPNRSLERVMFDVP